MEYTIKQASEALGVSTDTIRRRIKEGKITGKKVEGKNGPQWVIPENELTRHNASQVIEVIPVKRDLKPEDIQRYIVQAIEEGIEASQKATEARIGDLIEEVEQLKGMIETLTQALNKPEKAQEEQQPIKEKRGWKFWIKEK